MPRAVSLAPGLQKQPDRSETRRDAAKASTTGKSTIDPSGSSRLNGTVPPRSASSAGPYRLGGRLREAGGPDLDAGLGQARRKAATDLGIDVPALGRPYLGGHP